MDAVKVMLEAVLGKKVLRHIQWDRQPGAASPQLGSVTGWSLRQSVRSSILTIQSMGFQRKQGCGHQLACRLLQDVWSRHLADASCIKLRLLGSA